MTICVDLGKAGDNVPPKLERPGVVLTFDDTFITQWLAAQPIFAKYNAHVTFFVTTFDKLDATQLAGLQELKIAGHAIGCHGLRHLKAVDTMRQSSAKEYLSIEIEPALALMHAAGIEPTCFAYPSSQRNVETDTALAQYFRHLRAGTGVAPDQTLPRTEAIFTPVNDVLTRLCLIGAGIDYAGPQADQDKPLEYIFAALDRAAQRNEVIVFYAHNISDEVRGNHISPAVLEKILAHAVTAGLAFYTYDDLP
ncbi:MAG: polysaccharide deacetylase family protein [Kiritimatiellaeota bacterium]|nr:polysaccharide deacetylase family protein [Kiritimatiellota bacterium]